MKITPTTCDGAPNRYEMPSKIAVPADFDISELTKFWSQPKEGKGE